MGDRAGSSNFIGLVEQVRESINFREQHADAINAAFENEMMVQEEIKAELAELRKKESTSQMLQSGLIIVTGAVAIIATAGAATPIVIGGFAAGSFTMAYGVSNFEEAKNSYLLGSAGDP